MTRLIFTICTLRASLPRKMVPKLLIAFLHVSIAKKSIHLLVVQFIFFFWSFEISGNILRNHKKIII